MKHCHRGIFLNFELWTLLWTYIILGSLWFIPSNVMHLIISDFNGIIVFLFVLDWHDIWWYIGKLLMNLFQNSHFLISKDMFKVKLSVWYVCCKLWLHRKIMRRSLIFGKAASIHPAALRKRTASQVFSSGIFQKSYSKERVRVTVPVEYLLLCLNMVMPAALKFFSKSISYVYRNC